MRGGIRYLFRVGRGKVSNEKNHPGGTGTGRGMLSPSTSTFPRHSLSLPHPHPPHSNKPTHVNIPPVLDPTSHNPGGVVAAVSDDFDEGSSDGDSDFHEDGDAEGEGDDSQADLDD